MPVPMILAGIQAAGAVTGMMGAEKGARATRAAGRASARMIEMETAIAAERAQRDLDHLYGDATARVYASGIQMSGSSAEYMNVLRTRGREQIHDIKTLGEMKAKAAKRGANIQAGSLMTQGIASGLGGLANAGSTAYKGYAK